MTNWLSGKSPHVSHVFQGENEPKRQAKTRGKVRHSIACAKETTIHERVPRMKQSILGNLGEMRSRGEDDSMMTGYTKMERWMGTRLWKKNVSNYGVS